MNRVAVLAPPPPPAAMPLPVISYEFIRQKRGEKCRTCKEKQISIG